MNIAKKFFAAAYSLLLAQPAFAAQYLPYWSIPGVQQYVLCQGVDDTANIRAAIASSYRTIGLSGACRVTGTLTPLSNQSIQGLDPNTSMTLVSGVVSMLFDLTSLNNTYIANLSLNGAGAVAGGALIRFQNTTNSVLDNVSLVSPPSSANGSIEMSQASTGNKILGGSITNSAGSAISLNGSGVQGNTIDGVRFSGSALFNVHIYSTGSVGPSRNVVSNTYSTQSGLESIALNFGAFENRIFANHAEGAGDNGISISGYRNAVYGNELIGNQKAGIWVWGSQNTITANVGINNNLSAASWACIGYNGNFGGTGQNNSFTGNVCDDDQASPTQLGIIGQIPGYTAWAQGQSITSGNYRINGLNIYQASNSGTSGATPPTCTSGTCSDGTVTWTYLNSYLGSATTTATLSGNVVQRFSGSNAYAYAGYTYTNFGQGSINVVLGAGTPASNVTAPIGTVFLRSDGGANTTLYVKESGTGNTGWVAK